VRWVLLPLLELEPHILDKIFRRGVAALSPFLAIHLCTNFKIVLVPSESLITEKTSNKTAD